MSKYAVSYSPIARKIQIGRLNSKGSMFLDDKEYHTNDVVYAVIQHVISDFDGAMTFGVGDKEYLVKVEEVKL